MKTWQWVTIIAVAVTALLVGATFGPLFVGGSGAGYWGRSGMMRGYSGGMMGGFVPFGWFGMLLMWVFPLGALVLAVLGIVWLVNAVSQPKSQMPVVAARTCPNCARPVQADWRNCPYCGATLGQAL